MDIVKGSIITRKDEYLMNLVYDFKRGDKYIVKQVIIGSLGKKLKLSKLNGEEMSGVFDAERFNLVETKETKFEDYINGEEYV